jgi:hypothetical protein
MKRIWAHRSLAADFLQHKAAADGSQSGMGHGRLCHEQFPRFRNAALPRDGSLRADYLGNLELNLDRDSQWAMGVIFERLDRGQEQRDRDHALMGEFSQPLSMSWRLHSEQEKPLFELLRESLASKTNS